MELQFQVVDKNVLYTHPSKATYHSAGFDLYVSPTADSYVSIQPGRSHLFGTNLRVVNIPDGCYGRIAPRSGVSLTGIMVNAGVIDCDYTGELKILLHNISDRPVMINLHKAIAQLLIEHLYLFSTAIIIPNDEKVEETERGDKGFGSSDVKRQKTKGYIYDCDNKEYEPLLSSSDEEENPPSPPLVGIEPNPGPPHLTVYRGRVYFKNAGHYQWHPAYLTSQKAWKHQLHLCKGRAYQQWREMVEVHGKLRWNY